MVGTYRALDPSLKLEDERPGAAEKKLMKEDPF